MFQFELRRVHIETASSRYASAGGRLELVPCWLLFAATLSFRGFPGHDRLAVSSSRPCVSLEGPSCIYYYSEQTHTSRIFFKFLHTCTRVGPRSRASRSKCHGTAHALRQPPQPPCTRHRRATASVSTQASGGADAFVAARFFFHRRRPAMLIPELARQSEVSPYTCPQRCFFIYFMKPRPLSIDFRGRADAQKKGAGSRP